MISFPLSLFGYIFDIWTYSVFMDMNCPEKIIFFLFLVNDNDQKKSRTYHHHLHSYNNNKPLDHHWLLLYVQKMNIIRYVNIVVVDDDVFEYYINVERNE